MFIKCLTFEFQKNDPPFQLKLPPKAARPEKEVDPEYEEKMVSAFMTKHPAAFYGTWVLEQDQHSYKALLQPGCVRKEKQTKIHLDVVAQVVFLTVTYRSGSGSFVKYCSILPSIFVCMIFGVVACGFYTQ